MIYYVSIITLTWRDSCIKRWQFSTSTLYHTHPKFERATLPSFRHFRHLHSSWKDFDSGIRMQGYCFVQYSGVRQQFLADQWSMQTIWIARWKGMNMLKRGRDLLEESSKADKGYLWDMTSTIYYVSIITSTWRDSSIKRWQFSTSTLYHPKFEWATLPNFRHFRHLHSSWKDFDSGIRMQGYCLVQCSGVHQQVLADQWSVQTIWIARWKGIENLRRGRDLLEESSTPWKGHVRYDIDQSWWIDDLLCIHYHLDVARQLHQEMAIFDEKLVSSKVRMSDTPKFPSLWSPSLILKRFWFWDQDVRILPCTIFRGPSAVPGRSVVNANNLDRAVKRHENVEKRPGSFRRVFKSWQRVFVRYDIDDLLCIHHHLDVARQLHKEMAIFDEYLVSSKVRMSNTPKFPSLSSPSLILKGFWFWDQDARILPCTMFRGPSAGPGRSVVSAHNLDREVKGHRKFEKRPGSFKRVFNTLERACEIWYWLIMMNRWSIMYPLSPWRGETAASRDGNFRREACIIQSSNERHSQVSVTFVPFTHPEKVLILGSGCKHDALYNVQGSISRSWQISGQCTQSGSRGERA